MRTIKIELDFLIGPIIKDVYDASKNKIVTGISVIDDDGELERLNNEISNLYSSMYEFDTDDKPCLFNERKLAENKPRLMELLRKLIARLNEVSDGTFIVEDLATPALSKK